VTPLQEQFEILKAEFPDAELKPLQGGAFIISIPAIPLPAGWSKTATLVKFVTPVGYPFSPPDCFWTDADLKIGPGTMPQASANNPCPDGSTQLWFSWHVGQWNPNSDSLLTYVRVIKRRLDEVR
jgi:hypothetical protein